MHFAGEENETQKGKSGIELSPNSKQQSRISSPDPSYSEARKFNHELKDLLNSLVTTMTLKSGTPDSLSRALAVNRSFSPSRPGEVKELDPLCLRQPLLTQAPGVCPLPSWPSLRSFPVPASNFGVSRHSVKK